MVQKDVLVRENYQKGWTMLKNGKIGVFKWPYYSQFERYYFHIAVVCRAVQYGHACLVSGNSIEESFCYGHLEKKGKS